MDICISSNRKLAECVLDGDSLTMAYKQQSINVSKDNVDIVLDFAKRFGYDGIYITNVGM